MDFLFKSKKEAQGAIYCNKLLWSGSAHVIAPQWIQTTIRDSMWRKTNNKNKTAQKQHMHKGCIWKEQVQESQHRWGGKIQKEMETAVEAEIN